MKKHFTILAISVFVACISGPALASFVGGGETAGGGGQTQNNGGQTPANLPKYDPSVYRKFFEGRPEVKSYTQVCPHCAVVKEPNPSATYQKIYKKPEITDYKKLNPDLKIKSYQTLCDPCVAKKPTAK